MNQSIETRRGLPDEMQALLRDYPRDAWPDHPNFAASIQNWMGAHEMFRQLGDLTQSDTEAFLDNNLDMQDYVVRLSRFGNLLVRNLHGHHTWEDRSFFPELQKADARFVDGLDMLEMDHHALDDVLTNFTQSANRVVQLAQLDTSQVASEAGDVLAASARISGFLGRHLEDEEDLVVPIILHHKLRG